MNLRLRIRNGGEKKKKKICLLYPKSKHLQIGSYPIWHEIILLEAYLPQMHYPFTSKLQDKILIYKKRKIIQTLTFKLTFIIKFQFVLHVSTLLPAVIRYYI
jgi:hypothetical protein